MKKRQANSHRKKSQNRAVFRTRLAAYSVTTGAAMLGAPGVHAAITTITSLTGLASNSGPQNPPGLNLSGFNRYFFFQAGPFKVKIEGNNGKGYLDRNGVGARFASDSHSNALNLSFGAEIKGESFGPNVFIVSNAGGNFRPSGAGGERSGYVGLKQQVGSNLYYGWLRLKVINNGFGVPFRMEFMESLANPGIYGAYDLSANVAADNFTAGAIPEPSTLALGGLSLLAFGAAGVREMRRRRQAETVAAQ